MSSTASRGKLLILVALTLSLAVANCTSLVSVPAGACVEGSDCLSGVCGADARCADPTCTDRVKNRDEIDVDCGNSCGPCGPGGTCRGPESAAADCTSGICAALKCTAPSCTDNVKNSDETGVDCGGPTMVCPRCTGGQPCITGNDCEAGLSCSSSTKRCVSADCTDTMQNGNETDIDCGGSCGPCPAGKGCGTTADCVTSFCASGTCQVPPSCRELKMADANLRDGDYIIDPDGAAGGGSFFAQCDMTTDGGGWTLMATLYTTTDLTPGLPGHEWTEWSPDWFVQDHGNGIDRNSPFTNQSAARFKPLVAAGFVLRASSPSATVRRYHFGFTPGDWDAWAAPVQIKVSVDPAPPVFVGVIGPFNRQNVQVSTSPDLSNPKTALCNGEWTEGVFFLGTKAGGMDADSEGLGARYHVGGDQVGNAGFIGNQQIGSLWNLWVK